MKSFSLRALSFFAIACLFAVSCSKPRVTVEKLIGYWEETYLEEYHVLIEGNYSWRFSEGSLHQVTISPAPSMSYECIRGYSIDKGIITLAPAECKIGDVQFSIPEEYFVITKLTDTEMEWQRVGTSFSKEDVASMGRDFKHFKKQSSGIGILICF